MKTILAILVALMIGACNMTTVEQLGPQIVGQKMTTSFYDSVRADVVQADMAMFSTDTINHSEWTVYVMDTNDIIVDRYPLENSGLSVNGRNIDSSFWNGNGYTRTTNLVFSMDKNGYGFSVEHRRATSTWSPTDVCTLTYKYDPNAVYSFMYRDCVDKNTNEHTRKLYYIGLSVDLPEYQISYDVESAFDVGANNFYIRKVGLVGFSFVAPLSCGYDLSPYRTNNDASKANVVATQEHHDMLCGDGYNRYTYLILKTNDRIDWDEILVN